MFSEVFTEYRKKNLSVRRILTYTEKSKTKIYLSVAN